MIQDISEISGMTYIRVYSTMNDWLDCVFAVQKRDGQAAMSVLGHAYNDYWDDDTDECYGEFFCRKLDEAEIEYEVFYAPDEED